MNTPSTFPPTDNLYKFCALLGSIMVILAFYFPIIYIKEVRDKIEETKFSFAKTRILTDITTERIKEFGKIIDHTLEVQKGKPIPTDKIIMNYTDNEVKGMQSEIITLRKEEKLALAESEFYSNKLIFLGSLSWIVTLLMILFCFAGLYLAKWGYTNWYYKIQIYQDKEIKEKFEKDKVEEKK